MVAKNKLKRIEECPCWVVGVIFPSGFIDCNIYETSELRAHPSEWRVGGHCWTWNIHNQEFASYGLFNLTLEEAAEVEDWLEKEGWLNPDCYLDYGYRRRLNDNL